MSYPPDNYECQKLFDELRKLDLESESKFNPRKYEIIHELAEARYYEAKPYLIAGLKNSDPDYRLACVNALATHWRDADPQVVSLLSEISKNDPDISVRLLAIDSLGMLRAKEALPALKITAENKKHELKIRSRADKSFRDIAQHFPDVKDFPVFNLQAECLTLFEQLKLLKADPTHQFTEEDYDIITDLATAGFYEAKSYFVKGLDDSDPIYRKSCIIALGRIWKESSAEIVSKLLDLAKGDSDDSVRDLALLTLGLLKNKEALPLLKNIVEDDTQLLSARKTAYSQILHIYEYPADKVLAAIENFEISKVDKDLLNTIRGVSD